MNNQDNINREPQTMRTISARMPTVAAMVTLYNSDREVVRRIGTYITQVDKLYVVDNSEQPDGELVGIIRATYPAVTYIGSEGNKGIAYALNVAARQDEHDYLLAMDDDTEAPATMVADLLAFYLDHANEKIGIVDAQSDPTRFGIGFRAVDITITAGSLLNIKAYATCGPFMNALFIDAVDHEFSLRLRRAGYSLYELNYVRLNHRIGHFVRWTIGDWQVVGWAAHSPLRMYYRTRNTLYIFKHHRETITPNIKRFLKIEIARDIAKSLLLGNNRFYRLLLLGRAYLDYRMNRLGKHQ